MNLETMTTQPVLTSDELDHLVLMATYAPSVHSSQPWLFEPTADGLLLHMDLSRQLVVIEPDHRELLVSCGTAVHHLQVAARAIGVDAAVELLPAGGGAGPVAAGRRGAGRHAAPGPGGRAGRR